MNIRITYSNSDRWILLCKKRNILSSILVHVSPECLGLHGDVKAKERCQDELSCFRGNYDFPVLVSEKGKISHGMSHTIFSQSVDLAERLYFIEEHTIIF